MKILALDQASRTTGYSIWEDNTLLSFDKFDFNDEDIFIRIHKLCMGIEELINKTHPDVIILEDIAMRGGNVDTYHKLAWVQGALIELSFRLNIKLDIIDPNEWRKYCNFLKGEDKHRDNQKKIAQEWVKNSFNATCTQDEADAICIGYGWYKKQHDKIVWE